MDKLEKKTLKVSRGFTYTYYSTPAKDNKQTLLLIHGFPDEPATYEEVIRDYLIPNGYGAIAIDCLGFNGTSKPTDAASYSWQGIAQDLKDIVDNEGLKKVVSVGHDWGSALAQRFYNYHSDRCSGVVLMAVAYLPYTGEKFDLDTVNHQTEGIFGYGIYWYWKIFAAPEGPEVMDNHLESMWTMAHGEPETWLDNFCKDGGARNFLTSDKRQPTMAYATEERKQRWMASRKMAPGFDAPLNYYRSITTGVQDEAGKNIPKQDIPVHVPLLFFGGQRDYVCRPEMMQPSVDAGLIPDCTMVVVDSGHWAHLDKPKEFGEGLVKWLKEKF